MNNEEEILKECDKLFVTTANVHIDGKPMADLLDLYNKEKEKNKELDKYKTYYEEQNEVNKKWISKDKIREKLLKPVQEEGEKINKEFFKKDKGHFVESFCVEGAILQELGAIEEMILELLEESE